jgi:uracil-DNA glycosylase family 4
VSLVDKIEAKLTKKPRAKRRTKAQILADEAAGIVSKSRKPAIDPENPCDGCPCEHHPKIKPVLPSNPKIVVIGTAPGAQDEATGQPWSGEPGQLLRAALQEAGFDPQRDVGRVNLARCRPRNDDFDNAAWAQSERRCWHYLERDLQGYTGRVVVFGKRPLSKISGDPKLMINAYRGLWVKGKALNNVDAFVMRHLAQILKAREPLKTEWLRQFGTDIKRMAERVFNPPAPRAFEVKIFPDPWAAAGFLGKLAQHPHPWAADIESFDGAEFPSRKEVSTDPCHPDFRVHGIAFAWGPTKGAYVVLKDSYDRLDEASEILSPTFASPVSKRFFNRPFDEPGLVYTRWVNEIMNPEEDGMMALIALSDGRHESLRLEKAVTDLLGWPQYWSEMDKSLMRDLPIEDVARGAVGDACATWALCEVLGKRIKNEEYL